MFQVLVPTHPDNDILNPGATPDPRKSPIYTRRGRIFPHIEPAKRLAKRHLGKVVDVNSGLKVADYWV